VFKRDKPVKWQCGNCGFIYEGLEAVDTCPACKHPQAYFQLVEENF
jgi:rubrerythrin